MSSEKPKIPTLQKLIGFLKKLIIPALIIMPISLLISLYLAEKLVRFSNPQLTYNEAKKLSPQIYKKSDYLPFELEPNTETTHILHTYESTYHIRINSLGYRGSEFTIKKPANEFRILMLGDSMTFGFGVEEDDSLTTQLEKRLNRYIAENGIRDKNIKIINAAFADGKSPDTFYLYLKNKGLDLNPNLIIVNHFIINDIRDIDENSWDDLDSENLPIKISSKIHTIDGKYNRLKNEYQSWRYAFPVLKNSHLWILFATTLETKSPATVAKIKAVLRLKDAPPQVSEEESFECLFSSTCTERMKAILEKYFKIIDGTDRLTKSKNIPYFVAIMTANPQIKDIVEGLKEVTCTEDNLDQCQPQKVIKNYLEEKNIPFLDTLSYLAEPGYEKYFFPKDGHATKKGVTKYTDAFYDYLVEDIDILKIIPTR